MLDNHLQVALRLNDAAAAGWSDEETVRRLGKWFPPRGKDRQALKVTEAWVEHRREDTKWIAECRQRLNDLGWFMNRAVRSAARCRRYARKLVRPKTSTRLTTRTVAEFMRIPQCPNSDEFGYIVSAFNTEGAEGRREDKRGQRRDVGQECPTYKIS